MAKNTDHVLHVKSNVVIEGKPKLPQPNALVEGELAINYAEGVETISTKNSSGDIATFSSDNYYTKQKLGDYFTSEEGSAKTVTDVMIEKERVTAEAILDLRRTKADVEDIPEPIWERGTGENSAVLANGYNTASGDFSVAEGSGTTASGLRSHAEGGSTIASGQASHAEGYGTSATTTYTHAEGQNTKASGMYSHAEGDNTKASGESSHAEGRYTSAITTASHAEGDHTVARNLGEHASGIYNRSNKASGQFGDSGNTLFSIGNGGNTTNASHNAFEVRQNGDIYVADPTDSGATYYNRRVVKLQDVIGNVNADQVIDSTTSASTNPVSTSAVYNALVEDEEIIAAAFNELNTIKFDSATYDTAENKIIFKASGRTVSEIDTSSFTVDTDQVIDDTTKTSTNPVSTSAVYGFVTSYTPSITVDQVLDNTTSASTNPVSTKAVYDAVTENELVWTNAYVTLSGTVSAHTANTEIHVTAADKERWNSSSLWESGTGENAIVQKGGGNTASGKLSVAMGSDTTVSGDYSVAEGSDTIASGFAAHSEGSSTSGIGFTTHAEGCATLASGSYAHAEGWYTIASGYCSHAEGTRARASGSQSHAEGYGTSAMTDYSHAEGYNTVASGESSHAEGSGTLANGNYSHAEGQNTKANGSSSHAEGLYTTTNNQSEHASGQYNVSSSASTTFGDSGNTLFSVGNGTANDARHNAFEIRQNGDIYITSGNSEIKLQDSIESKADKTSDLDGLKLKKITQAAYDALATKDPNTLYVIVN